MEWWIKKLREASTSTHTHAVLQSGQLTIIAELTSCGRRLQEGDKLTPLANALYCINDNKSLTLKVLNATHFSAERWGAIANITAH
ncbi:histidine kinase [Klebsiella michiganensis]|uniref:histidine kinase n=1 Tax=Klebsiella michiganensis TaxID=1134687 RepID=UPI00165009B6|nr:histidine kinase [Klebsiella michiganensis]ELT9698374.1 histidine kinase [Klebsiella michiganensis]ELT9748321.1 histidine kinase [Klebsiella michiganensis]MBF8474463.1 histidine kinase [Klebsiella michiganensis]MBZ6601838.1 histidine kinase [Klebsiella michiganensis]MBZ7462562.1 histidine kinase [Klebsiella michiganensis]